MRCITSMGIKIFTIDIAGQCRQCSVNAGDWPFLRNDNSLILQSKISPFFHGFLQVLDCGDPLGP